MRHVIPQCLHYMESVLPPIVSLSSGLRGGWVKQKHLYPLQGRPQLSLQDLGGGGGCQLENVQGQGWSFKNRQRNSGTTEGKDDHAFFVVVGIGSTHTSLLANPGTAFNHREKKYEVRERER
jgi:hypothetical protein